MTMLLPTAADAPARATVQAARWASAFAVTMLCCGPAAAQLAFPSRTSTAFVDAAKSDLSDARLTIEASTNVVATGSASRALEFSPPDGFTSVTGSTTGIATLTAPQIETRYDPTYGFPYPVATATAGASGPGTGTFTIHESFATDTDPYSFAALHYYPDGSIYKDPAYGFLPAFTNTNLPSVELLLFIAGAGLVDEGGMFTYNVVLSGDFSTTAGLNSGSGQHYLNSFNYDAFAITKNFVYDPTSNTTTFSAVDRKYRYDPSGDHDLDPSLQLDLFLLGTPDGVPEPATWAMLTLGFGGIGYALRRKATSITHIRFASPATLPG